MFKRPAHGRRGHLRCGVAGDDETWTAGYLHLSLSLSLALLLAEPTAHLLVLAVVVVVALGCRRKVEWIEPTAERPGRKQVLLGRAGIISSDLVSFRFSAQRICGKFTASFEKHTHAHGRQVSAASLLAAHV